MPDINDLSSPLDTTAVRHDFHIDNGYYNPTNPTDPATDYGRRLSDRLYSRGAIRQRVTFPKNSAANNVLFFSILGIIVFGFFI